MKKWLFLLILFLWQNLDSQVVNVRAETEYLRLVLSQQRKDLVKDNLRNAEIVADSIIFNKLTGAEDFFVALSENYSFVKEYNLVIFSVLRYSIFEAKENQRLKENYFNAAKHLKISYSEASEIWNFIQKKSKDLSFEDKILLLVETSVKLRLKGIDKYLLKYVSHYQAKEKTSPLWLKQWLVVEHMKIPVSKRLKFIDFERKETDFMTTDDVYKTLKKHCFVRKFIFGID